jgi:glycosyltransferase involved in cell wall biosynthesis
MRVAITMVRDEEDIIGHTLAHLLAQVDHAIVADNLSVDSTRKILESFGQAVTVVVDDDPGYTQSVKMTRLAHMAGDMGADWVIPFDADEAWWLPDLDDLDADVVTCRPHVYVPQPSDPDDPNPLTRIQWRLPEPEPQHKVIFRYHPDAALHMGQHDVDRTGARCEGTRVRHYQYRSIEQVRRKVTNGVGAYNASGLSKIYGTHWRDLEALSPVELDDWWASYTGQPLVHDP